MPTEAQARAWFKAALEKRGIEPTLPVLQAVQAVSRYESGYGRGWGKGASHAGEGSNNMGAIQGGVASGSCLPSRQPPNIDPKTGEMYKFPTCDPARGFLHRDTIPQADGSSRPFMCCYRKYATPEEGAEDLVRVMFQIHDRENQVLPAAQAGDLGGVSAGMYDTGYYGGFGKNREKRIAGHMKRLEEGVKAQSKALGEPEALRRGGAPSTGVGIGGVLGLAALLGIGVLVVGSGD